MLGIMHTCTHLLDHQYLESSWNSILKDPLWKEGWGGKISGIYIPSVLQGGVSNDFHALFQCLTQF
jgi:hypothetical protein